MSLTLEKQKISRNIVKQEIMFFIYFLIYRFSTQTHTDSHTLQMMSYIYS